MAKSISEVGVYDLLRAGIGSEEEARILEKHLKQAISYGGGVMPEVWREITARNLLKPSHPFALHQLLYYSVYHNYDESLNGPPLYWFPSS